MLRFLKRHLWLFLNSTNKKLTNLFKEVCKTGTESRLQKENKTSFLKNVLMLMVAQVLVKVLGLVYRILIVDVEGFGNVGNGYYATGYQIYMVLLAISSMGIPNVISKMVSERVARGDYIGAKRLFKTALALFVSFGAALGVLLFFGAEFIATDILKASGVKYTLMVLSPAICLVSASAVMRGYFGGMGSMKANSTSQVVEQFFNCVLSVGFVYAAVGKDTAVMAAAGNLSTTLACLVATIYLLIYYRSRKAEINSVCAAQTVTSENIPIRKLVLVILSVSIPFSISSLISTANSAIDTVTVSRLIQKVFNNGTYDVVSLESVAMELYGILQKAETITHLPMAVSSTLYAAMVPVVSAAFSQNDIKTANRKISSSVFISSLIICPCMGGLVVLAEPILKMLYPSVPDGAPILQLLVLTLPLCSLTYILNGVLYGIGKLKMPAVALGIGAIVKLTLNIILISIPSLNIYGAVISTIIYQTVVFIIETVVVYKTVKIELDYKKSFLKPALSALVMSLAVISSYILLEKFTGNTLATIISVLVGAVVYAVALFIFKTFKREDVEELPFGRKIASALLKIGILK